MLSDVTAFGGQLSSEPLIIFVPPAGSPFEFHEVTQMLGLDPSNVQDLFYNQKASFMIEPSEAGGKEELVHIYVKNGFLFVPSFIDMGSDAAIFVAYGVTVNPKWRTITLLPDPDVFADELAFGYALNKQERALAFSKLMRSCAHIDRAGGLAMGVDPIGVYCRDMSVVSVLPQTLKAAFHGRIRKKRNQ